MAASKYPICTGDVDTGVDHPPVRLLKGCDNECPVCGAYAKLEEIRYYLVDDCAPAAESCLEQIAEMIDEFMGEVRHA
jgi:hypothetical protein